MDIIVEHSDFNISMEVFPLKALKEWFLKNRRSLPWRQNPTPYAVWVSETMLQQTQVSVVAPYFLRWMEQFPTIEALSKASLEQVLKLWEGLGYYSRARRLHQAAAYIMSCYGGELPSDPDLLTTIPGIGPYTQGAILNFAFHQKAVALDGNVLRVLSRYFAIDQPIDQSRTQRIIAHKLQKLLPDQEPWLISEGLIELGALICTKQPQCDRCPLQRHCGAYQEGLVQKIPFKLRQQKIIKVHRKVAIVRYEDRYLVVKRPKGQVMADLYEFPYLEQEEGELCELFSRHLQMPLRHEGVLCLQTHSFTKYQVTLEPHLFITSHQEANYTWVTQHEMETLPFSSGHRRILIAIRESSR